MRISDSLKDSHSRSLAKALSWRITGTAATVVLVYFFTGELRLSFEIGTLEFISKTGLFYLHERIWARLR